MKTKVRSTGIHVAVVLMSAAFSAAGCSQANPDPNHASNVNADMLKSGTPNGVPATLNRGTDFSKNTDLITIAARYVSLKKNTADTKAPTQGDAQTLMANMSEVWAQCNVKFILDDYQAPVAADKDLSFNPSNQSELETMRSAFDDGKHAVFVVTGKWNRSDGDLGNDGSNGWSTVPSMSPSGTVMEAQVNLNTLLISHEAGHLFGGLLHVSGSTQLMNHFVGSQNTELSASECREARGAVQKSHMAWLR